MVTCANGHGNQVAGGNCSVCGLALPAPGMQVWGAPAPPAVPGPLPSTAASATWQAPTDVSLPVATPPSRSSRKWTWVIAAIVALTFVVAAASTYFVLTKPVPNVVGMTASQARVALETAGFPDISTSEEFSDSIPRGDIASQDPSPGSRIRSGQSVALVVSRGEAKEVPAVVGQSQSQATRELEGLTLEVSVASQPSDTAPEGSVIAQDPRPGSVLEEGDKVELVVSSGPPFTTVTVTIDLFSVVLDSDFSDCSDAMNILQLFFTDSTFEDTQGRTISTLSGMWRESPGNGYIFPCEATGTFPRTSTQESTYVFFLDPSPGGSDGLTYTRSELESRGWKITLG